MIQTVDFMTYRPSRVKYNVSSFGGENKTKRKIPLHGGVHSKERPARINK